LRDEKIVRLVGKPSTYLPTARTGNPIGDVVTRIKDSMVMDSEFREILEPPQYGFDIDILVSLPEKGSPVVFPTAIGIILNTGVVLEMKGANTTRK
jgi:hypothetical protein